MKVSILIPVYGVEKYIERCARSAFEQTYKDLEYIFVDDCTQDKSIEILKRVLDDYPDRKGQVKIIKHEKNGGLSVARNTALDAATGDYIYYLDSDDELAKDCVEQMVAPLSQYKYDFVVADYKSVGFPVPQPPLNLSMGAYKGKDILDSYCKGDWYMMAWNKLLNRRFCLSHHLDFYPGIIHEDDLWSFHLACCATSMYVIKNQCYSYYCNKGSIMSSSSAEREASSSVIVLRELRRIMAQYHLAAPMYERPQLPLIYRIKYFMKLLGYSQYQIYRTVRKTECRSKAFLFKTYIKDGLHPFLFHCFMPISIGYYYKKAYSKIRTVF